MGMESWNRSEPWKMDHRTLGNAPRNLGRLTMEPWEPDYRTPVETEIPIVERSFAGRTPYGSGATHRRDTDLNSDLTHVHLQGLRMGSPPSHLYSLQTGPLVPQALYHGLSLGQEQESKEKPFRKAPPQHNTALSPTRATCPDGA